MTKNGRATPAPVLITTSGRKCRVTFQASQVLRIRLPTCRVVGRNAHTMRSPESSECASDVSNVTQSRSRSRHHGSRVITCARCPPDESANSTRRSPRADSAFGSPNPARRPLRPCSPLPDNTPSPLGADLLHRTIDVTKVSGARRGASVECPHSQVRCRLARD